MAQATPIKTETLTVRGGQKVIVTQEGRDETVQTRDDVRRELERVTQKEKDLMAQGEHKG